LTQSDEFDALVTERMRRHAAVVEQACEAAIAGGMYGVMVEWNAETTTAWVDPGVPYGQIHERVIPPDMDSPDHG
jgi:hypothetical protein